jgi:ankyrin repeat protein
MKGYEQRLSLLASFSLPLARLLSKNSDLGATMKARMLWCTLIFRLSAVMLLATSFITPTFCADIDKATTLHLRIIVVNSRADAEMVVEKLKAGQPFADLAKKFSTDSTRDHGGLFILPMGWLREEFQSALSGTRPGSTTDIFELVKGSERTFALLHCDDIEGPFDTPLLKAAEAGDSAAVKILLDKGANVNVVDDTGRTPLTFAAEKGSAEIVKMLLAGHANVNAATETGVTSLIYAASEGHADVVTMLLAAKARVNATTDSGHTALTFAAWNGHADVARLLLTSGANANAAASKRVAAGGMTFSPGFSASANTTVINGVTALMFASEGGHPDVAKLLLTSGARVNAVAINGTTALMFAAEGGHADVVKLLLAAGANVNAVAKNGDTALRLASHGDDTMSIGNLNLKLSGGPSKGYVDTVQLLKAAGAKQAEAAKTSKK